MPHHFPRYFTGLGSASGDKDLIMSWIDQPHTDDDTFKIKVLYTNRIRSVEVVVLMYVIEANTGRVVRTPINSGLVEGKVGPDQSVDGRESSSATHGSITFEWFGYRPTTKGTYYLRVSVEDELSHYQYGSTDSNNFTV